MSSPVFGQLEASLAGYLADVVHRAEAGDDRTAAAVARDELPRSSGRSGRCSTSHDPDRGGRCPNCRHGRFGRAPVPCRAYLSAHLCLVAAEDEPAPVEIPAPARRLVVLAEPPGVRMRG